MTGKAVINASEGRAFFEKVCGQISVIKPFDDMVWEKDFTEKLLVKADLITEEEQEKQLTNDELFAIFESIFLDKCEDL